MKFVLAASLMVATVFTSATTLKKTPATVFANPSVKKLQLIADPYPICPSCRCAFNEFCLPVDLLGHSKQSVLTKGIEAKG